MNNIRPVLLSASDLCLEHTYAASKETHLPKGMSDSTHSIRLFVCVGACVCIISQLIMNCPEYSQPDIPHYIFNVTSESSQVGGC